jgi:hypothetical protein
MGHFDKWGPSARNCLELASGTITEEELEFKANLAAMKFAEDPVTVAMEANLEDNSHLLFTTIPASSNISKKANKL